MIEGGNLFGDGPAREAERPHVLIRNRVLDRLREVPGGLTADECAASLALAVTSVRPRFTELLSDDIIEATGERRALASRRSARVYRATRDPRPRVAATARSSE